MNKQLVTLMIAAIIGTPGIAKPKPVTELDQAYKLVYNYPEVIAFEKKIKATPGYSKVLSQDEKEKQAHVYSIYVYGLVDGQQKPGHWYTVNVQTKSVKRNDKKPSPL